MTKNSRYLYINIYLFIYLFAYLLGRVTVKYSILTLFLHSLVFLLYFRIYLAIFVCFSFYFGCIIIIVIFFRFLLTPQTAIRTPHTDPAFSEHPSDKASQRGRL